jgi:hypothetical protein
MKEILVEIRPMPEYNIVKVPASAISKGINLREVSKIVVSEFLGNEKEILIDDVLGQLKEGISEKENF